MTWNPIASADRGMPGVPVNALVLASSGANPVLYAGTDVGVYQGVFDGRNWSWTRFGDGLPNVQIKDLRLRTYGTGTVLAAATYGRGAYWIALPWGTVTSLTSSADPSVPGQAVTFTSSVSGGGGAPTGTVQFMDGLTVLGTATLDGNGRATLTTSGLAVGSHPITAVYGGDAVNAGSASASLTQMVNQATTSTSLTSSADPSVPGQAVTFTATVARSSGGAPTGPVTFMDGTTALGTVVLDANGVATLTTSGLSLGAHSITAVYGGDAADAGSTSSALTQVVQQQSTSTSLSSSADPSAPGQAVTFTASVFASGGGAATGTVRFMDGQTLLGTAAVGANGVATFTTSGLAVGSHSITAVYGGDAADAGSTSSALTQVVSLPPTSTSLSSSADPSTPGQAVTFTATVSAAGTPTGTVSFYDGGTLLGTGAVSNGVATFTTAGLSRGSHSITAVYGGDATYNGSTSSALTQMVQ